MEWEAWFTISTVCVLILAMARGWAPPDLLAVCALTLILAMGQLSGSDLLPSPREAVSQLRGSMPSAWKLEVR